MNSLRNFIIEKMWNILTVMGISIFSKLKKYFKKKTKIFKNIIFIRKYHFYITFKRLSSLHLFKNIFCCIFWGFEHFFQDLFYLKTLILESISRTFWGPSESRKMSWTGPHYSRCNSLTLALFKNPEKICFFSKIKKFKNMVF